MGHTTFQATLWFTLWLIYVRITPLPHRSNVITLTPTGEAVDTAQYNDDWKHK